MLEKTAYLANIVSAFIGLYCAYASWMLLHPDKKPAVAAGESIVSAHGLVTIFVVSLVLAASSAVITVTMFVRSKSGERLEQANQQLSDRSSELDTALFEIEKLKEAADKAKGASASVGDINISLNQGNQQHAQQQQQALPPTPATPKEPKPDPHIVRLPPRLAWIQIESGVYRERDSTYTRAVLAVYENEVQHDKKTGEIRNVVAKIIFCDERGIELADFRINEGCWMNAYNEVNFTRNARHEVILAIKEGGAFRIVREAARYGSVRNTKFNQQGRLFVKVQLIGEGILRTDEYLITLTDNAFEIDAV